jgi:hypothetical protein
MARVTLAAVTAVLSPAAGWTAEMPGADWWFAPPDASFLAGIETVRIRASLESWLRQAGVRVPAADLRNFDRLERITVAGALRGETPSFIALLERSFKPEDVKAWRRTAAGGISSAGVSGRVPKGGASEIDVRIAAPRQVLIGDAAEVRAALRRLESRNTIDSKAEADEAGKPSAGRDTTPPGPAGLAAALAAAAPALRQVDFWIVGSIPKDIAPLLTRPLAARKSMAADPAEPGIPAAISAVPAPRPRTIRILSQASGPVEIRLP